MKKCSNSGKTPVYLNVYDITAKNTYGYWLGLGIYHSGFEVYGVEWAFGGRDEHESGIFEDMPKKFTGFKFRRSIMIGRTNLDLNGVRALIQKMGEEYMANTYNLLTKNCNHFSNDACVRLTGKSVPNWVNRLAKIATMCMCVLPLGSSSIRAKLIRVSEEIETLNLKAIEHNKAQGSRQVQSPCASIPYSSPKSDTEESDNS
ncbi:hypothetical protein GIB67_036906 [Kingdonia uniflora]|uniref:PPPDE domain-containing protein n=1 Tax=Kingdonia uniflora TaxID=39325 RepID=A0A7J7NWF4_9MAGN|nr:hypothetical protein GIB67_036906 [Kingdonia uniflora]